MIYALYWSECFAIAEEAGLPTPAVQHRTLFIALGIKDKQHKANEELIGIFSIAWRRIYADITRSRMENAPFKLENAKKRSFCMIYNRLKGYAKACKDFCNERRGTGRKHVLPKYLYRERERIFKDLRPLTGSAHSSPTDRPGANLTPLDPHTWLGWRCVGVSLDPKVRQCGVKATLHRHPCRAPATPLPSP